MATTAAVAVVLEGASAKTVAGIVANGGGHVEKEL